MVFSILFFILLLSASFQLWFWGKNYILIAKKDSRIETKSGTSKDRKVSVVISSRNNGENLVRNLETLCSQNYPNYEVLVIDDGSTDNTADLLPIALGRFENLRVYRREKVKGEQGKRAALKLGLEKATGDFILFTDSDCKPSSPYWIGKMLDYVVSSKIDLVIGLSPYRLGNGLLNKVIQFETSHTALLMVGRAKTGRPYMALGRNMLIRTSALKDIGAFEEHDLLSGDDDLTVNSFARGANTVCCTDPGAMTFSPAIQSWSDYSRQKKRHFSAGKYYKSEDKIFLGFLSLGHALFLPVLFLFFIGGYSSFFVFGILLFLLRQLLIILNFYKAKTSYSFRLPLSYVLLLDIFYPLYYLFFSSYIFWSDVRRW